MTRILQSGWFVVLVGGCLYISVTTVLLRGVPAMAAKNTEPVAPAGPSWDYSNPELEQLITDVGSSRVDLQACKLEYSIVSPK